LQVISDCCATLRAQNLGLKGAADAARLLIHCSLAHHETLMPLAAKHPRTMCSDPCYCWS
jgi:hypothetical protein